MKNVKLRAMLSIFGMLVVALALGARSAYADATTLYVSVCNTNLCTSENTTPGATTFATIGLTTSGSGVNEVINVTITMQSDPDANGGLGALFVLAGQVNFDVAGSTSAYSVDGLPSGWTASNPSNSIDGFGSFDFEVSKPGGKVSSLTFTVHCTGGCSSVGLLTNDTSSGDTGTSSWVLHVTDPDASGTVTGGFAGVVPEPASLLLLGTGLLGLGAVRWRIRKHDD